MSNDAFTEPPLGSDPEPDYPSAASQPEEHTPARAAEEKPHRSPLLGIIGFFGVLVFGIVLIVIFNTMGVALGPSYGQMVAATTSGTAGATSSIASSMVPKMGGIARYAGITMVLGLLSWIVTIVATAMKRGRGWGIAGIILGVVMPIASIAFLIVTLRSNMG